ncbi:MAG: dTDP-4-dehydrorhamnose reductase [Pannonibacter sp.]
MPRFKVLVAGASGQVARALVDTAPADMVDMVALGRPQLDLADWPSVEAAVRTVSPDIVINAAAYTGVDQAESEETAALLINAEGAGFLASAAAKAGAPILHLSTDFVFAGDKSSPYLETDPVGPTGAYGRTKLAGERAVADANPRHAILRTAWVYSPYGKNFAKTMLRFGETREEVGVVHDQRGNPTSAQDIAEGLWRIARQIVDAPGTLSPGIFHMTARGEASWAEFAEEIFRLSAALGGPVARVRRITTAEFPTPTRRPANSRLDCTKLADAFGLILPHWQASTHACVEQLIKNRGWVS